ncbi:putative enterotoxin [Ophiocordyceps camponoti-floridani]|uniref:Putative enterotoxin n=1 Tax=Ophiocordyceps camponoti-floridani TaxID=2030778 RepID=A0A8H4Q7J4_9HYPO|nr:putative enterotoxin [Ophiocordyceps camponoti-floridani]
MAPSQLLQTRAMLMAMLALCLFLWPVSSQTMPRVLEPSTRPPLIRRGSASPQVSASNPRGAAQAIIRTRPPAIRPRSAISGDWQALVHLPDSRTPEEIKRDGGFLPARPPQSDEAFSLYLHATRHVEMESAYGDDCIFLSTTRKFTLAAEEIKKQGQGWVYIIYPSPNMFDQSKSLSDHDPHPESETVVAVGGIHWSQVLGWVHVSHRKRDRVIAPNPDFDRSWLALPLTGPQPQLAGFCDGRKGCGAHLSEKVGAFMDGVGGRSAGGGVAPFREGGV